MKKSYLTTAAAAIIFILFAVFTVFFAIDIVKTEQAKEAEEEATKAKYIEYLNTLTASEILNIITEQPTTTAAVYRNKIKYYSGIEKKCYHEKYIAEAAAIIAEQEKAIEAAEKQIAINQLFIDYYSGNYKFE